MRKFKKTYIEITNVCNLSCEFCPKTSRRGEFMEPELFEDILKQIKGYSKHLYFHVLGEPLLHPRLATFLDLAKEHGYLVNLTTNGTLIGDVKEILLAKEALRQVNLSLHSFEANENDSKSSVAGSALDSYLDRLFDFIHEAVSKTKLLICLRLWNLQGGNFPEGNIHIYRRIEKEFLLNYSLAEQLTPCRGIKLAENIFLNQSKSFQWPDMEIPDYGSEGFCYGLREQIAILVDGTVVPCCLDGEGVIALGNIKKKSFGEIIEGTRAKTIYDEFSNRKVVEPLCRKCEYRHRFNLR